MKKLFRLTLNINTNYQKASKFKLSFGYNFEAILNLCYYFITNVP